MLAQLVTYSGTNGVAFNPAEVVAPIINAAIAAVGAAVALFVISVGMRLLFRAVGESGASAPDLSGDNDWHVNDWKQEQNFNEFVRPRD